jgi:cyclophilin family peptidyl-prolyl cis-trans isomerase/HEAT repeat protein
MSSKKQKVFNHILPRSRNTFSSVVPVSFALLLLLELTGCGSSPGVNRFSDPIQQKIAGLQDRRSADSLVTFLSSGNSTHRLEAALALASVQDSTSAPMLGNLLLEDKDANVRATAAFALGQIGSIAATNALIPAMDDNDSIVRYEVRVAMGKIIKAPDFPSLLSNNSSDVFSTRGMAWALFHLGSRKLADSTIVAKAVSLLASPDRDTQLGTVHFFSRSVYPPQAAVQQALSKAARSTDGEVRMAAVFALRKFINAEGLDVIKQAIDDADYRVRVNAVRSLQGFELNRVAESYRKAIQDKTESVVVAVAEALRQRKGYTANDIAELLEACKNWRAKAVLTDVMLSLDPSNERINTVDLNIEDPYHLAAMLDALGSAPAAYPKIVEKLFSANEKVVQSTAASALVKINRSPAFTTAMQKEFADIYQRAIAGGDQGVILYVCGALADSSLGYNSVITNIDFLKQARNKLSLPKDFETVLPLERAIAWFEGKPAPQPPVNTYNHPIDWTLASRISSDQKMLIRTSRGDITIRLFIDEAPGSVVNFVKLAESKYFDGRFVHRVVPTFVIQTGCHRGDGFGSEDYSIRSEFSRCRYKTGSVGMASAGKDTEGTQWFITHSPAPHLDGKYTIFAEVVDGQASVDEIEVGDRIVSASLVKN